MLRDCPRIHLETAAGQFRGTAALVRDQVPVLLAQAPAHVVHGGAWSRPTRWPRWRRSRTGSPSGPPRPSEGRDPRLGRRLWEAKLWHTLDTELTAAEVLSAAPGRTWSGSAAEIREVAAELVGGRADDDTVRPALNRLADEHPDDASIVGLAERTLAETTDVRPRSTTSSRWSTIRA